MHTTTSEDESVNYGCSDAKIMMTIAKSNIQSLIDEEADRMYAARSEKEVEIQISENPLRHAWAR